jgi:hypothetical protein
LQVLVFFIISDYNYSKNALWQAALLLMALHLSTFLLMIFDGRVDQYSLTVMIHQALLFNGPQIIHLFKFGHKTYHRRLFVANTLCTLAEFFLSCFRPAWINRNGNFCLELSSALKAVQAERVNWTIVPLVLNCVLTICDILKAKSDQYINKDRKPDEHHRHTVPRSVTWDKQHWTVRRKVYCVIGSLLLFLSICNVEINIIRDFHERARDFIGLSSSENDWKYYGQIIAGIVSPLGFLVVLRLYLRSFTKKYAKKTKGMPCWEILIKSLAVDLGIETFADERERKWCAIWTFIYYQLTHIEPRKPRGKSKRPGMRPAVTPDEYVEGEHSSSGDVRVNSGVADNYINVDALPVQRVNNGRGSLLSCLCCRLLLT